MCPFGMCYFQRWLSQDQELEPWDSLWLNPSWDPSQPTSLEPLHFLETVCKPVMQHSWPWHASPIHSKIHVLGVPPLTSQRRSAHCSVLSFALSAQKNNCIYWPSVLISVCLTRSDPHKWQLPHVHWHAYHLPCSLCHQFSCITYCIRNKLMRTAMNIVPAFTDMPLKL
jgi:hypothetical protein